jgi:hypothetical protein
MALCVVGVFSVSVGMVGYCGKSLSAAHRWFAVFLGMASLPVPVLGGAVNAIAVLVILVSGGWFLLQLRAK